MRNIIYKNTILFLLLFSNQLVFSQKKFDLRLNEIQLNIDGKSLVGYESNFDFSRDDVRKGWWKYARKFGSPTDMRTYYVVTIPSDATDGNVELAIYSQTVEEGGSIKFKIGLEEKKYKVQVEEMLKEFKKEFYIQYYLEQLKSREVEAEKISNDYASALLDSEKEELLTALNQKRGEVESLKEELRNIDSK